MTKKEINDIRELLSSGRERTATAWAAIGNIYERQKREWEREGINPTRWVKNTFFPKLNLSDVHSRFMGGRLLNKSAAWFNALLDGEITFMHARYAATLLLKEPRETFHETAKSMLEDAKSLPATKFSTMLRSARAVMRGDADFDGEVVMAGTVEFSCSIPIELYTAFCREKLSMEGQVGGRITTADAFATMFSIYQASQSASMPKTQLRCVK